MEIYDGNIRDTTNFDTDRFLKINGCGYQNRAKDSAVIRKKGRVDYHLVLENLRLCITVRCFASVREEYSSMNRGMSIITER